MNAIGVQAVSDADITTPEFQSLFSAHPGGVAVITLADPDGRPVGFTATSVISLSAEPPLLAFSVMNKSSCWPAVSTASQVLVHFIDAREVSLARRFATPGIDRFSEVEWSPTADGLPLLEAPSTWARAEIVSRQAVGSSWIVIARVKQAETAGSHTPVVYHNRTFHELGTQSVIS